MSRSMWRDNLLFTVGKRFLCLIRILCKSSDSVFVEEDWYLAEFLKFSHDASLSINVAFADFEQRKERNINWTRSINCAIGSVNWARANFKVPVISFSRLDNIKDHLLQESRANKLKMITVDTICNYFSIPVPIASLVSLYR